MRWWSTGVACLLALGLSVAPTASQAADPVSTATLASQIADLQALSTYVSHLYPRYGPGLPYSAGFDALLHASEGNCAQESYLFARMARSKGYAVKVVEVWAEDGANHVVAEVDVGGQWHAFDPTNGLHYPTSVESLVADPSKVAIHDGQPEEFSKYYATEAFWDQVDKLVFHDSLNYAETNLLTSAEEASESGFMQAPYDARSMLAGASYASTGGGAPAEVSFRFPKPVKPYRLNIESVRTDVPAPRVRVEAEQNGRWQAIPTGGAVVNAGGSQLDLILQLSHPVDVIRIHFDNPVYVKAMGLYE